MLKYNEPLEVTKKQYDVLIVECAGIIAHKIIDGKYFIKLWMPKYKKLVIDILNYFK